MPDTSKQTPKATPAPKKPAVAARDREAVLGDFRRIVGPLRGQNRDQKPKS